MFLLPYSLRGLLSLPLLLMLLLSSSFALAQQLGALLWEENFNSLNTGHWNLVEGDGCQYGSDLCGWGNQELEYYLANNVAIEEVPGEVGNYALALQVKREVFGASNFTSGRVDSQGKVAVHYGMIETRIRVPDLDLGLWPAFWLLGTSTSTWPAKGEIDMMEMGNKRSHIDAFHSGTPLNNFTGSNLIFYADAACTDGNPTCAASTAWETDNGYSAAQALNDRFVIYRLYWTEDQLRFTIVDNGVEHQIYAMPFTISDESSEFRQPFYLLMNMAVGGNFTDVASAGQVTAPLPAKMYVDYIRVYELDGQGSVQVGATQSVGGDFGVFTELAATSASLQAGTSSDVYVWSLNSLSEGAEPPYEGDEALSWQYTAPGSWFGAGVLSRQPLDMNLFEQGELRFHIKIPADISFRVGITDTYSNQYFVNFPAGQGVYGLERNGNWGEAVIPISELRGDLIALQSIAYPFAILSDDAQLPTKVFSFSIDNILWTGAPFVDASSSSRSSVSSSSSSSSSSSISSSSSNSSFSSSSSSSSSQALYGLEMSTTDEVRLFVNTNAWADVHYRINNTAQINVRMTQNAGSNSFRVGGLVVGDIITYSFTYWDEQLFGAVDTAIVQYPFQGDSAAQSSSSSVSSDDQQGSPSVGAVQAGGNVTFYVSSDAWADVHYQLNGGAQQNIRMTQLGGGNEYSIDGFTAGDALSYTFTYWNTVQGFAETTPVVTLIVE